MPLFYILAFFSMVSLFLSSKIIFHKFTKQPQVFDHKMNSFMLRAICIAVFSHVLASMYFVSVEDIFPEKEG
jgi:acyl-ACP thioesterase